MINYLLTTIFFMMICINPLYAAQTSLNNNSFKAYVLKSNGQYYREYDVDKKKTIKVRPKEEYSIVVRNPLPVRVAVAVSIDGLNSIDGERTSTRNAKKWLIEPNSSLKIEGWQTSNKTLRKFLFTEDTAAYAKWREDKEGKPYGKNMGVIGIAWFWNQQELDYELHPPQPFIEEKAEAEMSRLGAPKSSAMPSKAAQQPAQAKKRAGTGMGDVKQNRVKEVEFNPTAGMFKLKDVLKIYYEFAEEPDEPQPFIEEDKDDVRFAPPMP